MPSMTVVCAGALSSMSSSTVAGLPKVSWNRRASANAVMITMPVPKCGAALGCIAQATRTRLAAVIRSAMRSGIWPVMWAIPTGG